MGWNTRVLVWLFCGWACIACLAREHDTLRRNKRRSHNQQHRLTYTPQNTADMRCIVYVMGASKRYLYIRGDSLITNRAFFSLFRWHWHYSHAAGDVHILGDHSSGRWLTMLMPSARLDVAPPESNQSAAQLFWVVKVATAELQCYLLYLDVTHTTALGVDAHDAGALTRVTAADAATFCFAPLEVDHAPRQRRWNHAAGRPLTAGTDLKLGGLATFATRVQRSITQVKGRKFVLVTYHNIGMLDWAVLFWKWLHRVGIQRFMLLELDGMTCNAARALNCSLHFECATIRDMTSLPSRYTEIRDASSMQEWGTDAYSGYFKFLRWKLCIVELLLKQRVDVLMADVDVLVLSPHFFSTLASSPYDLTISSDARRGKYNDNPHCPLSHAMYQRYSTDWVCAGLFYVRCTDAALWFIHEVQEMMDRFVITDQDAIQAVLTGHTQVAVPQMKVNASAVATKRQRTEAIALKRGYRPSPEWLKPTWLEGLDTSQTLRNTRGIQPLNTPMRPGMWERVSKRRRTAGFTWATTPVSSFANGPMVFEKWHTIFSQGTYQAAGFVSVHANCNVKAFLMQEINGGSFLLHPESAVA